MYALTSAALDAVLQQLSEARAAVHRSADDYGNARVDIQGHVEVPVLSRHAVIGGEELVAITEAGAYLRCPAPNGDPFGPVDDASAEIERLWQQVVAAFPAAAL